MVDTISYANPKAGALFRLLTSRAGITGEMIAGGVLQNPLPIPQAASSIMGGLAAATAALAVVTAPPEESFITDALSGEKIPNPRFEETKGLPQPLDGHEEEFYTLQSLIATLGETHVALTKGPTSLQGHTDRVVNNLVDLCGLAQAYTQTIIKISLGSPLNTRVGTKEMSQVPNISNATNKVNLGGITGSSLGQEAGFQQITMPEVLTAGLDAPRLNDISSGSLYGSGFKNQERLYNTPELSDYREITNLNRLLDASGIPAGILPPEAILAEVNPAAHCETLFHSILPEKFGGLGQPILSSIMASTNFTSVDLFDVSVVQNIINEINTQTNKSRALVTRERSNWSDDMLRPPTFPNGFVLQVIYQVSRCETISTMATDSEVQGILYSCITPLTEEILRTGDA